MAVLKAKAKQVRHSHGVMLGIGDGLEQNMLPHSRRGPVCVSYETRYPLFLLKERVFDVRTTQVLAHQGIMGQQIPAAIVTVWAEGTLFASVCCLSVSVYVSLCCHD